MSGIPVLIAEGDCIARAWENAMLRAVRRRAATCKTQYDKPGDPPSKDATMIITVHEPLAEPMIHRDFPGGLRGAAGIRHGGLRGDQGPLRPRPAAIRPTPAGNTRTINGCSRYEVPTLPPDRPDRAALPAAGRDPATRGVPRRSPGRSGRTTAATIRPVCRASGAGSSRRTARRVLSMNVRFRSNDAYKAAFMNIFALVQLQSRIAARVGELCGRPLALGRYCHMADSFHIYGVELGGVSRAVSGGDRETHVRPADDAL